MRQLGISPKVIVPVAVQLIVGVILLAIGEREIGVGLLLGAAATAGGGYLAPPGVVVHPPEPTLHPEVY